MKIKGKHVLITGAANGIGKELAKLFYAAGATVIAWDIDDISLKDLKRELPNIIATKIDISDRIKVIWGANQSPKVDILINNAGIGHNGSLDKIGNLTMDKLIDVNYKAPLEIVSRYLPYLKTHNGHIVNVSSGQAFFKLPTWAAYASTKSALSAWSELLGVELGKYGVTVTTVYPFMVNTGFYRGVGSSDDSWATRMSMKLLPFYSNKPETVAKKIFDACVTRKRVEMVHPFNYVGYHLDTIPSVGHAIRWIANKFLSK